MGDFTTAQTSATESERVAYALLVFCFTVVPLGI